MTLEQALAYIQDDELVEVTPKSIRLRKRSRSERAQEGGAGQGGDERLRGGGMHALRGWLA